MVFSSALFIFGFAPIFFFCYFSVPERGRNPVILVASILFYALGAGTVALVLMGSVWLNQFVARRLVVSDRKNSARLLAMGVGLNLAALIYYKYTAFGWNIVANMFQGLAGVSFGSAPRIVLPIGISFFTFQGISYIIDVHRRRVLPASGYFDFAVYHTLFPQLVAGPIVRYIEIQDRLYRRSIDLGRLTEGAYRFCLGLGKKIVIADNLSNIADQIIKLPTHELTCSHAWLGVPC